MPSHWTHFNHICIMLWLRQHFPICWGFLLGTDDGCFSLERAWMACGHVVVVLLFSLKFPHGECFPALFSPRALDSSQSQLRNICLGGRQSLSVIQYKRVFFGCRYLCVWACFVSSCCTQLHLTVINVACFTLTWMESHTTLFHNNFLTKCWIANITGRLFQDLLLTRWAQAKDKSRILTQ